MTSFEKLMPVTASKLKQQQATIDALVAALKEVRDWIRNWGPNFTEDSEWHETQARMDAAISKATTGGDAS